MAGTERAATRRRVGPLLLKVCWADKQRSFAFEHDESEVVVVGSGRDADVRVDNGSVAPVQLHFERIDGRIWVVPDRLGEVRMNRCWLTTPEVVDGSAVLKLAGSWLDLTVHPLESAGVGSSCSGVVRRPRTDADRRDVPRPLGATAAWRVPRSFDDGEVTPVRRPPDVTGVCRNPAENPPTLLPPARPGVTTSMTVAIGAPRARPDSAAPPLAMHVDPEPTPVVAVPALDVDDAPPRTVSEPAVARRRPVAKPAEAKHKVPFSVATPRKRLWSNLFALVSAIGEFALRRPFATLALTVSYGLLVGALLAHVPRVLALRGSSSSGATCAALSAATSR